MLWLVLLLLSGLGLERAAAATDYCSGLTTTGINFGTYNTVTKAAVDSTGTISFSCTGIGTDKLKVEISAGNSGSCTPRYMANTATPAETMGYQIYTDPARTSEWCGTNKALEFNVDYRTSPTQNFTFTMFGRVMAGQNPAAGTYTDTLIVKVRPILSGPDYATTTKEFTGSVDMTCGVSATNMGFGTYVATAPTPKDSTATLTVSCTKNTFYRVRLDGGQNLNGAQRRMAGPVGSYLGYGLFQDSARSTAWGDGTGLGGTVSNYGTGNNQNYSVFGRIPTGQWTAAGAFSDSVRVTVEY